MKEEEEEVGQTTGAADHLKTEKRRRSRAEQSRGEGRGAKNRWHSLVEGRNGKSIEISDEE